MIDAKQNVFLILDVLNLFKSDDVSDGQYFQGIIFPLFALLSTEDHSAECSGS